MSRALESIIDCKRGAKGKVVQMDCHALQSKARNDKEADSKAQAESISEGHSNVVNESVDTKTQDSRQQDLDSKSEAKRKESNKQEKISQSDSKILREKSAFSSDCARSYLSGSDEAQARRIGDLSLKAESQDKEKQ